MTAAEIEDLINRPKTHQITKIQVLRARGRLPENNQVGPTCGIYALQAAFDIKGNRIAPRKQVFGDWRSTGGFRPTDSIRGKAKAMGLSKIGEIGGAADLAALAGGLGIPVTVERFSSENELWTLILDAVNAGKGIVMPYACAGNDGAPAWSTGADGFAHWCLVFGYVEYLLRGERRIFMTTYGKYLEFSPYRLFKANQRIQDWPRQNWIKLTLWFKDPGKPNWEVWKNNWQAEATVLNDIKEMANNTGPGVGFGIGDETHVLHKVIDPPNPRHNLSITAATLRRATLKSADLQKVEYTKSLCGQCVVV